MCILAIENLGLAFGMQAYEETKLINLEECEEQWRNNVHDCLKDCMEVVV